MLESRDPRAVYHDDLQDYASNEPTMDGTASALLMWAVLTLSPSPPPLEVVAAAFPDLEILECIRRGEMGVVYRHARASSSVWWR